jgi:hypothetical protein
MAEKVDKDLVDDLMKCAISMSAFNTEDDLNMRMSHLQQINKEYNSLVHKLDSEDITLGELELAAPVAAEGLRKELERRSDLQLDDAGLDRMVQSSKGTLGQVMNFLRQGRTIEIGISLKFNRPEPEGPK